MVAALLKLGFLVAAGLLLWRLVAIPRKESRVLYFLFLGGFILRAVLGALAFWISYLGLPIFRSLQAGNGIWFFGVDAKFYYPLAAAAAEQDIFAILSIPSSAASAGYIKVLSVFILLFGEVVSVAVLLNLFAYLGTGLLIMHLARRYRVDMRITALTMFVVAFLPSWVLWSLQPLKDGLFCFLIVLFAVVLQELLVAWKPPMAASQVRMFIRYAGILLFTLYLIAAIRWYYALMTLAATGIPLLAGVFSRPLRGSRVVLRLGTAALLVVVMIQAIVHGAGDYLAPPVRRVLVLSSAGGSLGDRAEAAWEMLRRARESFDQYRSAGTQILPGKAVRRVEQQQVAPPAAPHVVTAPASSSEAGSRMTPATESVPKTAGPGPGAAPAGDDPTVAGAQTPASDVPQTHGGRLITGTAALLLPRSVAVRAGLISVGGGRGFWWFAEADSVMMFAGLLGVVSVLLVAFRRGVLWDPYLWFLAVLTMLSAGVLAYAVSNYGTLFRHREMVVATAMLIPIAALRKRPEVEGPMIKSPEPQMTEVMGANVIDPAPSE